MIPNSFVSCAIAAMLALVGIAGGPQSGDAQVPATRDSSRMVAIRLLASASADEVRFAREPRISVRLHGALDSVKVLERRNLPRPVVAGQTYRNVYIAVEILGRIDAECLAARLGVAQPSGDACAAITIEGVAPDSARSPPP